ncbi:MAG: alpha-glucuronidase family glycosyl hydrolase [Bryobacteraceae bacterium]
MLSKLCVLFGLIAAGAAQAETGRQAWLRYTELKGPSLQQYRETIPSVVTVLNKSAIAENAQQELVRGVRGMIGRTLREESSIPKEGAVVLGTEAAIRAAFPEWQTGATLKEDEYVLKTIRRGPLRYTIVAAQNDRGVLYGVFHLLDKIALGDAIDSLDERQSPYAPGESVGQPGWFH